MSLNSVPSATTNQTGMSVLDVWMLYESRVLAGRNKLFIEMPESG